MLRTIRPRLLVAGLLLAMLPAGALAQDPVELTGSWDLAQFVLDGTLTDVPDGVTATLVLDGAGGAGGQGGCNSWFGTATVDGSDLTFSGVGSTMMACEEPRMSTEAAYLQALGQVATWSITDGRLVLADAAGDTVLAFTETVTAPIEGVAWQLTDAWYEGELGEVPAGVSATLLLDAGAASGSGGCNQFFGSYTLDGNAIGFSGIGRTEMACPQPQMGVEDAYLEALALTAAWEGDATSLRLLDGAGTVVLAFQAGVTTVEGDWLVSGITDGSGSLTAPVASATARFTTEGTVAGSTGCNQFTGDYTTDGASIAIGPLATTRMACRDEDVSAQETAYLAALDAATTWRTTADGGLELLDDAGVVLVAFAAGAAQPA
jgi:putative lipoprotein